MSLRLRLFRPFLKWVVKPHLARTPTPQKARAEFEWSARLTFRRVPFTIQLEETVSLQDRSLRLVWVSAGAVRNDTVLLYLHGGGYIVGSPETHAAMMAHLSKLAGTRVVMPDYRLAPEHAFPAQLDDALAAWQALLDKGYAPENIMIGGDSAGGGLALSLLAELCQRGQHPAACVCFSPWTDLTLTGKSLQDNARSDLLLSVERINELREYFLHSSAPDNPRASPLLANFPNCPPVFMQYSTTEILADDARRMATALETQGAQVTLEPWTDLPHVWHIFQGALPEADQALAKTAQFMRAHFPAPPPAGN